eukprot:scaffold50811_cov75-Phaeocystis_antarctica.AAC.1
MVCASRAPATPGAHEKTRPVSSSTPMGACTWRSPGGTTPRTRAMYSLRMRPQRRSALSFFAPRRPRPSSRTPDTCRSSLCTHLTASSTGEKRSGRDASSTPSTVFLRKRPAGWTGHPRALGAGAQKVSLDTA